MSLSIIQLFKLEVLSCVLILCTIKIMLNRSWLLDSNLEPYSSLHVDACSLFFAETLFPPLLSMILHSLSLAFSECFLFA